MERLHVGLMSVIVAAAFSLSAEMAYGQVDHTKAAVVLPFESSVKGNPGFLEQARTTVIAFLKEDKTFASVLDPADAAGKDKASMMELHARLVEFKAGNMATRAVVGLGSGRASAALEFSLTDAQSGKVVWNKTIKEKASVWSNSASSTAQRLELPEKIAKTLINELHGKKR